MPGMSNAAELFILSAISRAIFRERQRRYIEQGSAATSGNVLISIEEAQRVLSQRSEKTGIFREIAMEGRKFGVGLGVITQQPKNIDQRVLAQMNTLFVMGLLTGKIVILLSHLQNTIFVCWIQKFRPLTGDVIIPLWVYRSRSVVTSTILKITSIPSGNLHNDRTEIY
jgi:hypothetical protein